MWLFTPSQQPVSMRRKVQGTKPLSSNNTESRHGICGLIRRQTAFEHVGILNYARIACAQAFYFAER